MNGESDALPGISIEIGMRGREGLRFGGGVSPKPST